MNLLSKRTLALSFLLGVVLGGGGVWMWSQKGQPAVKQVTSPPPVAQIASTEPNGPSHSMAADFIFKTGPLSDSDWWELASQGGSIRASALRRKAAEILAMPHLSQRRRLLSALLEAYQPGDWRAILDGLVDREKIGGRFDQEYELLMERAAETDGGVILERILKESGGEGFPKYDWQKRCMANWAAGDNNSAITWWNQLPDGEFRDFLSGPLIEGLARNNIDRAWEMAQLFDPPDRMRFAGDLARSFAADKGPEAAAGWIAGLAADQGPFKAEALTELSKYIHQIDFPLQGKLVGQFADQPWAVQSQAFREVARVWGQIDSPATMEWAAQLPAGKSRERALREAIHQWALKDAEASGAWLERNPEDPNLERLRAVWQDTLRSRGLPHEGSNGG